MTKLITIVFGILLTILGVWNYSAEGATSLWALMPAVYGLLAILFAVLQGRWEHNFPLFGAMMMAIITLIGSLRGFWNLFALLIGNEATLPTELIWIRCVRGVLSIAFILYVVWQTDNFWPQWKSFGHFLGDWLGRAGLTIFYFTVFVPFGISVRLFSDPLHIKNRPDDQWRPRSTGDQTPEDVLRQF